MSEIHDVKVVLQDGMHFVGTTEEAGYAIQLDAEEAHGGQGLGMRSVEMVLVGLAGCTAMDVISILRKKRQEVTGLEVHVRAERADEHPRVYTHIEIMYIVTGRQVSPAAVERSVELSITSYCPVAAMLRSAVPIETSYQIIETAGTA